MADYKVFPLGDPTNLLLETEDVDAANTLAKDKSNEYDTPTVVVALSVDGNLTTTVSVFSSGIKMV